MHECPECGQACDCDDDDTWMDTDDCTHACDDERDELDVCVDCGSPSVADMCQCCGGWLCYMHSETGAGFCKACPTQEWIADQNAAMAEAVMAIAPIFGEPLRA
jgi:hypothetical protein